jgi:hypothetical protein
MGLFPRIPDPEMETFAEHRHEWQGKHPGVKMFQYTPQGPVLDDGGGV